MIEIKNPGLIDKKFDEQFAILNLLEDRQSNQEQYNSLIDLLTCLNGAK